MRTLPQRISLPCPDWLHTEINRQHADLLDAMTAAAASPDIAAYDSPTVNRLLSNTATRTDGEIHGTPTG